jgi:hypothetical protein
MSKKKKKKKNNNNNSSNYLFADNNKHIILQRYWINNDHKKFNFTKTPTSFKLKLKLIPGNPY